MKKITSILILAVIFNSISAFSTETSVVYTNPSDVAKSSEFSVMTFNVENLFDVEHDKGTEDFTYLPLKKKKSSKEAQQFCNEMRPGFYQTQCKELDWNKDVLKAKLSSIEKVIKYVEKGQGPDNILFAEVENEKVLKQLVQKNLKGLGYKTVVLIEGPDLRGIDPAFISKFPMVGKPVLHIIPFVDSDPEALKKAQRSRGILEVTVTAPNGVNVTFMSAHFPSQSNPTAWREQAVRFANDLMKKYQAEGRTVILGGDLNIIATEEAKHGYFKNILSESADVSHLVGCKQCEGTHNYRGSWSFLDVLAFSKNFKNFKLELIPESILVVKSPVNVDEKGIPMRFDEKTLTGVTDHLPVYARVRMK